MFNFNRMSNGFGPHHHQQTSRKFSTMTGFNTMPATGFLNKFDLQNISAQKRFANPNFVNKHNPNIHSYPSGHNPPLREICTEFYKKSNSFCAEQIAPKENTHRKKDHTKRTNNRSPRKSHKNKMNIDIKYEIDEVGIDCLSDQFESDSNDATPTVEVETPPVFVHKAMPEIEIKTEICKISTSPICIAIGTPEQVTAMVASIAGGCHRRLSSECSEDSFVVFQYGDEDVSFTETDIESEDEDEDSMCSSDEEDVCDIGRIELDEPTSPGCKVGKKVRIFLFCQR